MKIKLILYKSLIMESVKVETHLKSVVDRSTDDKAIQLAYHEAAGDDETHQRKLLRGIDVSFARLKDEIANFLDSNSSTAGNNVYSEEEGDNLYLFLAVDRRFNQSMVDPLAKLCSKFIEDNTVALWYKALGMTAMMESYETSVVGDMVSIKNAFAKKVPYAVHIPYTSHLTVTPGTSVSVAGGESTTITYAIDEGAVDDIEIEAEAGSSAYFSIDRAPGCGFIINGISAGSANVRLYSAHSESTVYKDLSVSVLMELPNGDTHLTS